MPFEKLFIKLCAAVILVIRTGIQLIFLPYITMRDIVNKTGKAEVGILVSLCFVYFFVSSYIRFNVYIFISGIIFYCGSIFFFTVLPGKNTIAERLKKYVRSWSYTLFPTLLWFYTNALLFILLPPPRTVSLLGKTFSIFFITFSLSLFVWKLILIYLSIRFSSRIGLYRVFYYLMIYILLLIPISYCFYILGFSRIPFV